jgi:hypothetical protein
MKVSLVLVIVAVAFGGLTFLIEKTEQKAATCSVHNRTAGKMARVLGIFSGVVAVGLLASAFFLRDL